MTATFLVKNVNLHEAEQQWTDCQSHGGNINGNSGIFLVKDVDSAHWTSTGPKELALGGMMALAMAMLAMAVMVVTGALW